MKRLAEILLHGAARFGDRLAAADAGGELSYAALAGEASRIGRGLRQLGLDSGDRSIVVLPNGLNFLQAHFANVLAGLVSVPADATLSSESLNGIAASCEPRCLLTDATSLERLTAAGSLPSCLRHVVVFGGSANRLNGRDVILASELSELQSGDLLDVPRREDDLAALMYTTGTTGRPKGVMLTHANILAALRSIVEFVGYTERDREVIVLPLSHNFGLGHVYCNLMCGGAVFVENGLARVGRVLKAIESFRATGFPGTPLGFGMLIDQYGPVLAQKGRGLRFSVINSAPLPPERTAQLQALLPQLDIMIYYGLTEASRTSFISLTRHGPSHYRSAGRPMKHVHVEVRSPVGQSLNAGETGEVVIRGPAVTRGYWNDPEQTAASFTDGWLRTGDLGHVDHDGFLWITGRLKDVINVGGYKVNPSDVEKAVLAFPGVVDVAAVGIEGLDGLTGETVVAAVVAGSGASLDEHALQQHCVARLEKFKVPARFVFVAAISRTNTGKIKRAEVVRDVSAALGLSVAARS